MKKIINIAPEGYQIIFYTALIWALTYLSSIYFEYSLIQLASVYLFYILLIVCYFFRDPIRDIIYNNENFLSPADGKIVSIKPFEDKDLGKSIKIAIFLSFFNVHRQWIPLNAKVIDSNYNPGRFFGAFKDKASEKNEQTSILFSDINKNEFKIKQIAGFVARRIVNHMNPHLDVCQGEKLGFIKFGSRADIFLPLGTKVCIKKDQNMISGETLIAVLD